MTESLVAYGATAAIGAIVGLSELLFRYKDSPNRLFKRGGTWAYVAFNAGAAIAALGLTAAMGWTFGQVGTEKTAVTRVLVAGFGSIALFRSSLFVVKAGDQNIGAGPSLVLASLLGVADRAVDREQAQERADEVGPVMADVDFELAQHALVYFALTATVSVSSKEREEVKSAVAALSSSQFAGEIKSKILGLLLVDVVGVDVLKKSVAALGNSITKPAPPPPLTP